jgi:broad specificity phosphatase PhoE
MASCLVEHLREEKHLSLWVSPFQSAVDTANALKQEFELRQAPFVLETRQSIYLAEQPSKLRGASSDLDGASPEELSQCRLLKEAGFGFWARPLQGESAFDTSMRVDFFLRMVLPSKGTHIIVSHDVCIRAFQLMELDLPVSMYNFLPVPENASVYLLPGDETSRLLVSVAQQP